MLASSPSFHVESDINSRGNPPDSAKRHPALVSEQHMARYLAEFTFRANHRQKVNRMFDRLVAQF